jgi:hypothetical protein
MKWYSTKHGLGDIIGPIRVQYILAMSSEPERLVIRAAAYVVVGSLQLLMLMAVSLQLCLSI